MPALIQKGLSLSVLLVTKRLQSPNQ